MDQHTVALNNLKLSISEFQTISLYTKLPHTLRTIFKRDLGANLMKYSVFADKVTQEMSNLRMSERVNSGQNFKKQPLSSISTFKVQATRKPPSSSNYNSNNNSACLLCNEKHFWVRCNKYSSPQEKKRGAQSQRLFLVFAKRSLVR